MSQDKAKNPNRRYVAKVKKVESQNGEFLTIIVDNHSPTKKDGSQDPYHKGVLVWLDNETGKKYHVKGLSVRGVGEASERFGFTNSISIDLDNDFEVTELG